MAIFVSFLWFFGVMCWIANAPKQPQHDECSSSTQSIKADPRACETFWERTTRDPIAVFTLSLALFSAILTVATLIQIRFVVRADITARKAADAATRAAQATEDTIKTMDKTAEKQLRACIFVDDAQFVPNPDNGSWFIHLETKNFGQTPAYDGIIMTEFDLSAPKPKDVLLSLTAKAETHPKTSFGPEKVIVTRIHFPDMARWRSGWDLETQAKREAYLWGTIRYQTFGKEYVTSFQMVCRFGAIANFGFCEKGNEAE